PLSAQTAEEIWRLEPITVTSTRVARELSEIPLSVSVVDERQIRENPKPDVAEYLRELPGVKVSESDWGVYEFNIRGAGKDRSLILVDGVRQSLASALRTENEAGLLAVEPSEIERIEVIKGPASALYGSDAIGGVINVITKTKGGKPLGADVGLFYDASNQGFRPRASVYGAQGGFYWRASGSMRKSQNRRLPNSGRLLHSDQKRDFYSARVGYEWAGGAFDLGVSRYDGWRDLPGTYVDNYQLKQYPRSSMYAPTGVVVPRAANSPGRGQSLYSSIPEEINQQLTAKLTLNNLSESFKTLTINFFARQYKMDFDYYGFMVDAQGVPYSLTNLYGTNKSDSLGGTAQAELELGPHRLTLGFDVEKGSIQSQGDYEGVYANRGGRDENRKGYTVSLAAFAQDEWSLTKDLDLTAGLRYSYQKNVLSEDIPFPEKEGSSTETAVVGSLGLVYRPWTGLSLRALVAQGFRAPKLTWQFGGTSQRFIPNPNLGPEKSLNYEIGARYAAHNFNIDLAIFYSKLKDAFLEVDSGQLNAVFPPATSAIYQNADNAKSLGLELAASYYFRNLGLTPYLSVTFIHYKRTFPNGRETTDVGIPKSWGVAGLKFSRDLPDNLRLFWDAAMTWSGSQFIDTEDGVLRPNNNVIYGHGCKVDLTIGLEGGVDRQYRGSISLKNIGDRQYQPDGFFQPGFHVVADFGVSF
ncbi:MAG: TonB-dependent receptor, partial [Deltaproteobacteria bacterium]|nr:TonB-dependent receptor [Deltaproteobacteria bacterium]